MPVTIADNLARIRERIATAVARRGPGPEPLLIGVSKRQPVAAIAAAVAAGLTDLGENYAQELRDKAQELRDKAQELRDKAQELRDAKPLRWHFIGHLQRNKVKHVVGTAGLIHTVDRAALADAIEARAAREGQLQELLVEVNLGDETQKSGITAAALPALLDHFATTPHLRCRGLMVIPPLGPLVTTRGYFARLRGLRDRLATDDRPHVTLEHLSMGMSADFEAAIEEGATMVRVGSALFGPRLA